MKKKYFLLIFFLILFVPFVHAIAVNGNLNTIVYYQPGLKQDISYSALNKYSRVIAVTIEPLGDMSQYVTVEPNSFSLNSQESKAFTVHLALPEKLPPEIKYGWHKIHISVGEDSPGGGMVGARAVVNMNVKVFIPKDGKYAEAVLSAAYTTDLENFQLTVYNYGTEQIYSAYGEIAIYNEKNEYLTTLKTDAQPIDKEASVNLHSSWNLTGVLPSNYYANATVYYDDQITYSSTDFRVGEIKINIDDYTKNFQKGKINKFKVQISSGWNLPINNIWADIRVYQNGRVFQQIKSPSIELGAFQPGELIAYLDTETMELGDYPVKITVNYADKITEVEGTIHVLETLPEEETTTTTIKPNEEKPAAAKSFSTKTFITVGIAVLLIILVLINIILLLKKRGGANEKKNK